MNAGYIVTVILSVSTFFLSLTLLLYKINKKEPSLIKPSRERRNTVEKKFRYDFNFLAGIGLLCYALSEGVYFLCNIPLLFFWHELYIDIVNLIPVSIIYTVFLFILLRDFIEQYLID